MKPFPPVQPVQKKKPIIRGKDKILQAAAKANTHLRFPADNDDDDDDEKVKQE